MTSIPDNEYELLLTDPVVEQRVVDRILRSFRRHNPALARTALRMTVEQLEHLAGQLRDRDAPAEDQRYVRWLLAECACLIPRRRPRSEPLPELDEPPTAPVSEPETVPETPDLPPADMDEPAAAKSNQRYSADLAEPAPPPVANGAMLRRFRPSPTT